MEYCQFSPLVLPPKAGFSPSRLPRKWNLCSMDQIIHNNLIQIKELMLQFGVHKAYAFGNAAKDEMNSGSDTDFIIAFEPGMNYKTYATNYFRLLYALQGLLKKDVDLVAEETLTNPYLIQSINQHKVQVI
jgi:predicted nucleotidyltransferase